MWWIFQEAEQLFSILPPPPQIMLNSGRLRLALQRGKHLLLSRLLPFPRGRFFHQVQPSTQKSDPGGKRFRDKGVTNKERFDTKFQLALRGKQIYLRYFCTSSLGAAAHASVSEV